MRTVTSESVFLIVCTFFFTLGDVYLARQTARNRPVVVKVESFAAAQSR
jgi:hypothetical protein